MADTARQDPHVSSAGSAEGRTTGDSWPLAPEGRIVVQLRCPEELTELVADRLMVLGASAVAEQARRGEPRRARSLAGSEDAESPDSHTGAGRAVVTLVADLIPAAMSELESWCKVEVPDVVLSQLDSDLCWPDNGDRLDRSYRAARFLVRPPWVEEQRKPGEVELVIDPGDTFGSGSHPTTQMCLEVLADTVTGGERVLDVGCGSGILAVAALALGASQAVGVDIDPRARAVSERVASANGVSDRFEFRGDSLDDAGGGFDVVVANLLIGSIEEMGAALRGSCAAHGTVVLSGILVEQRARALGAVDLVPQAELQNDGWVTLVLK